MEREAAEAKVAEERRAKREQAEMEAKKVHQQIETGSHPSCVFVHPRRLASKTGTQKRAARPCTRVKLRLCVTIIMQDRLSFPVRTTNDVLWACVDTVVECVDTHGKG